MSDSFQCRFLFEMTYASIRLGCVRPQGKGKIKVWGWAGFDGAPARAALKINAGNNYVLRIISCGTFGHIISQVCCLPGVNLAMIIRRRTEARTTLTFVFCQLHWVSLPAGCRRGV